MRKTAEAVVLVEYGSIRQLDSTAMQLVRQEQTSTRKDKSSLKLLPAKEHLISLRSFIFVPLSKAKSSQRLLLVIRDRFSKMPQTVPLRKIDSYAVFRVFSDEWVFRYGSPETVLSDNF